MTKNKAIPKIPVQQRAIQTREKIVLSAVALFSEKGFYKTNAIDIAKGAGVATGTFYIYFKDKKALLIEIIQKFYRDVTEKVLKESADGFTRMTDIKALVHGIIKAFYLAHEIVPDLHREVSAIILLDTEVGDVYREEEKKVYDLVYSILKEYRHCLRISDLEAAAVMVFKVSDEILHLSKITGSPVEEHRLMAELEDMLCRYLAKPD